MKPCQVHSWLGHQRRQLSNEIQRLEDDVRSAIPKAFAPLMGQAFTVGRFEYAALLTAAGTAMHPLQGLHLWLKKHAALPLALMILLALADSLLNAILYFPAIVAAGAIAVRRPAV